MAEDKAKLQQTINKVVDLMIQDEAIREQISEHLKEIKKEFDIPVPTASAYYNNVTCHNTFQPALQNCHDLVELLPSFAF